MAVRQLHNRHHLKDCGYVPPGLPEDGLTRELEAALEHLIAISDWAPPRTITVEHASAGHAVVVGDAFFELNGRRFGPDSPANEVADAWASSSGTTSPALSCDHGIAVMIINEGRVEWFHFQVPRGILGAFRQRKQYITLLESMPAIAAATVWPELGNRAYFYFGDNDGSKYSYWRQNSI